jgi:hypothetical protein
MESAQLRFPIFAGSHNYIEVEDRTEMANRKRME